VKKCATAVDGVATFTGTFTMTAGNGDTLSGAYAGAQVGAPDEPDANGYGEFQGTFTITEGTGRFRHASGVLSFAAVTSPFSAHASLPALTGVAFYLVEGTVLSPRKE
jgi:hypothetical protein